MAVIVTFGVVFALALVLAIGGIWDTSGDQATKGLARFYGILMLPCLAASLLVFRGELVCVRFFIPGSLSFVHTARKKWGR